MNLTNLNVIPPAFVGTIVGCYITFLIWQVKKHRAYRRDLKSKIKNKVSLMTNYVRFLIMYDVKIKKH